MRLSKQHLLTVITLAAAFITALTQTTEAGVRSSKWPLFGARLEVITAPVIGEVTTLRAQYRPEEFCTTGVELEVVTDGPLQYLGPPKWTDKSPDTALRTVELQVIIPDDTVSGLHFIIRCGEFEYGLRHYFRTTGDEVESRHGFPQYWPREMNASPTVRQSDASQPSPVGADSAASPAGDSLSRGMNYAPLRVIEGSLPPEEIEPRFNEMDAILALPPEYILRVRLELSDSTDVDSVLVHVDSLGQELIPGVYSTTIRRRALEVLGNLGVRITFLDVISDLKQSQEK